MTTAIRVIRFDQVRWTQRRPGDRARRRVVDLVKAASHATTEIEPQLLLGPNGGPVWSTAIRSNLTPTAP